MKTMLSKNLSQEVIVKTWQKSYTGVKYKKKNDGITVLWYLNKNCRWFGP